MKKMILIAVLVLTAGALSTAQIPAGAFGVGGDLSISRSTQEEGRGETKQETINFDFEAAPHVGFFVAKNIEVGAEFGYGYSKSTDKRQAIVDENGTSLTVEPWDKSISYTIRPYVQYYKFFGEKFGCFLWAYGEIEKRTITFHDFDYGKYAELIGNDPAYDGPIPYREEKWKDNYWHVGLQPGFIYFITKNLGVTTSIGSLVFGSDSFETDPDYKSTTKHMGVEFSLSHIEVGLEYFFRK